MRAVRGKPTKEQSQRNEELWRATEKFIELSDKEVGMPMHRSWEDWLSLRNQIRWSPEILLRHATRMSSVEQNEALSALQIEYPELFGLPGTPFRATDDFADRALEILGLDREELKLDFREKDVFGRPLPPKEEPPIRTLPIPRGAQFAENKLKKIIKEELKIILAEEELEEVYSEKQRKYMCAQASKPASKRPKGLSKKEAREMCRSKKLKKKKSKK
jgi:hypothetical protein